MSVATISTRPNIPVLISRIRFGDKRGTITFRFSPIGHKAYDVTIQEPPDVAIVGTVSGKDWIATHYGRQLMNGAYAPKKPGF